MSIGDSAYSSQSLSGRELVTAVEPAELRAEELYYCTIIRSESPTEFWVRLAGWQERLGEISRRLRERYSNAVSPGQFGWEEGDYCALRHPDKDWVRALITRMKEMEELPEVLLIDHGISTKAARRLIKPIPEQISRISWLSVKVRLETEAIPKNFQLREDVAGNIKEFVQLADRVAIQVSLVLSFLPACHYSAVQVSARGEQPHIWLGDVFFFLDQDYLQPPLVRTHRFRASTLLVRPPSPDDPD